MTKKQLKATSLKNTMLSSIVIISILSITGFYFVQDYLTKEFITNNTSKPTTNLTVDFAEITKEISENKVNIDTINNFFLNDDNYQMTINDNLNKYASSLGIAINSKDWSGQDNSSGQKLVTISLKSPVAIDKLIKFLKAIENSLPKMSVASLSITPTAKSNTLVTVDPILIEVYKR